MTDTIATAPTGSFRIADLVDPVLSDLQRAAMAQAEANPVRFDPEAILDAARNATGLSDFGDADFLPRLRMWCAAVEADAGLGPLGRAGIWGEMVRFASNRLLAEDLIRREPAILDTAIETPLVVAGLPRSGTTFLLQVLAGDRQMRSLPYWEAVRPVPGPYVVDGDDTRLARCDAECADLDAMLPHLKAMHEYTAEHVSEDYELQCIDFGSYYIDWLSHAEPWREYYMAHDHAPIYRYMRKMFQLLSWQRGPDRWVTKCPQHMEQLVAVTEALPGSTVAITHRDPVASLQSAMTIMAYRARIWRRSVDMDEIAAYWTDRYERLLRRCVEQHDRVDSSRLQDVYFHELMADPIGVVERLYGQANVPFGSEARADIEAAIAANPRGKHGQVVYDMRADFGVDPEAVRDRFRFYYDRFPAVRIEVK